MIAADLDSSLFILRGDDMQDCFGILTNQREEEEDEEEEELGKEDRPGPCEGTG